MIAWKRRAPAVTAYRQVFALWLSVGVVLIAGKVGADPTPEANWVAKVVSIQGNVWVRKPMDRQWQVVNLDDHFLAGDEIQVGRNSRAAFVLCNDSTLRVDQQTTLVFSEAKPKKPLLMELIAGTVHFFSRIQRSLHLTTPFVNGAVEGTEFVVRVETDQATITLIEGRMTVSNPQGSARLWPNQAVTVLADQPPVQMAIVHPWDAVHWALYYPAVIDFKPADFPCEEQWCAAARQSVEAWRRGDLTEAFETVSKVPEAIDHPRLQLYRAALQLAVGRVDEATAALDQVRLSAAQPSDALSLLAVIAVVQNRKEAARQLVEQAAAAASTGSGADMAGAYVHQAFFDLEAALASVRTAVQKEPHNALAWARLSELSLARGERTQALSAARRAAVLRPDLAHTMTVLGFAYLAQIKTAQAKQSFAEAINFDSASPMARLGMGLVKIRDGQLAEGRGEIEIAACLDPGNALIRSYLGKAYYEEKRDDPAKVQLAAAKKLDPADPTPWFYDAIRKQSINRPVEALHDLQTSIDLNDNRAVYRSRFLLDEDLAVRSAGIGQIYRDLGFQQLALVQGWKSVNADPTNYSAHRFLADNYSALPRHEIARVSELLQSQMLQPLNVTPIQPSLAETKRFILDGTEPSAPGFNEFSPLFLRNRLALQTSGVVGSQSTWGDEIAFSGLYDRYSFSFGQFHHETDGFRDNNDHKSNIYNFFAQVNATPEVSLMAEFRYSDKENGDLPLRFSGDFFEDSRQEADQRSLRLGGRYSPNQRNDILGTVITSQIDSQDFDFGDIYGQEEMGYMAEIQHLFRGDRFNLISGIGFFHSDSDFTDMFAGEAEPLVSEARVDHTTPYIYSYILVPENVTWTLGASMDFFDGKVKEELFNPKIGVTWNLTPTTTFRAAAFRTFKRNLIADQTLEPTQVAGFNQFYDDANRTKAWRYGAAIDQELGLNLFAGLEYAERDMEISYTDFDLQIHSVGWDEQAGRIYLFWTPHKWISAGVEYVYSRFERDGTFVGEELFTILETHKLPLSVNFFHPSGLFLRLKATYIDQEGEFGWPRFFPTESGSDQFWVADAALGYRLPKRCGIFSLEAKNLFDQGFQFQDTNPSNPEIIPKQSILAKITLAF